MKFKKTLFQLQVHTYYLIIVHLVSNYNCNLPHYVLTTYFRTYDYQWQNLIRNRLSSNKAFYVRPGEKDTTSGDNATGPQDAVWRIDYDNLGKLEPWLKKMTNKSWKENIVFDEDKIDIKDLGNNEENEESNAGSNIDELGETEVNTIEEFEASSADNFKNSNSKSRGPAAAIYFDTSNYKTLELPNGEKIYQCFYCDRQLKQQRNASRHILTTHIGQRDFQCISCKRAFTTLQVLKRHLIAAHKYDHENADLKLYESLGIAKPRNSNVVDEHNYFDPQAEEHQVHKCGKCKKSFVFHIELKKHIAKHHKNLKCLICGQSFDLRQELNVHTKLNHPASPAEKLPKPTQFVKCDLCEKMFTTKQTLNRHKDGKHGEKIHPCNICGRKFKTTLALSRHIKKMHEGEKNYKCDQCTDQEFFEIGQLKRHIYLIHEDHQENKCPNCERNFYRASELHNHIAQFHEKRKDHVCDACGARYANNQQLVHHVNYVHKGIRATCEICGFSSSTEKGLQDHKKTQHDGPKEFPCQRCDDKFCTLRQLKIHNAKNHRDCKYCGKVFKGNGRRSTLKTHMEAVHEGLKRYTCETCGKSFYSKADMSRHVDSVHLKIPGVWSRYPSKRLKTDMNNTTTL